MFALRRCTPFDDATATVRRIGLILLACSILSRAESARVSALTTFPPWFLKTYPPLPPRREVVNFAQRFLDCPV